FDHLASISTSIYPLTNDYKFFYKNPSQWNGIGRVKIKGCFFLSPKYYPDELKMSALRTVGTYNFSANLK
ncbi:MAG: hypothetical protein KDE33_29665, partial [Bacteroidetes bacterium]|nr:hypothetical protein [Bacteroidota bacterium]